MSHLFEGYRTIGVVCDDVPFNLKRLGTRRFVTVSIGKGFLVYDLEKLVVKLVSPSHILSENISCIVSTKDMTYTACGNEIFEWKRASLTRTILAKGHDYGAIVSMCIFGQSLLAITAKYLLAINLDTAKLSRAIMCGGQSSQVSLTCLLHPDTYLNKVLVGKSTGAMELWNIRSGKCIYRFKSLGAGIVCLENSPAIDVIGIGLLDGRIIVHNLKLDTTLVQFHHKGGSVNSLSFRTDVGGPSGPKFPTMISASSTGDIAVWDLEEKRLVSTVESAHDGSISMASFLPNEPLLVSSGCDNALKVHIFDLEDGRCRLLKSRQGHKTPPLRIRYYGGDTISTLSTGADAACCQILSSGRDRSFRLFHTAREQLNRELSQGPLLKRAKRLDVRVEELKLPPIIDFAATEARERDWCNILSVHSKESAAYTWQLENRVIGKKVLRPDGESGLLSLRKLNTDKVSLRAGKFPAALCVAISVCGNFGLVGTADGTVFKYNMQSGLPRGSYPKPVSRHLTKAQKRVDNAKRRKLDAASIHLFPGVEDEPLEPTPALLRQHPDRHQAPVTGIAVDALNSTLISASQDCTVKFWDFVEHSLQQVVDMGSPVCQLILNRDSGIFAVSCDSLKIFILDVTTRKIIRTFAGHQAKIVDMTFSSDARWLVSGSVDTSLRVWDLPTSRCIDWIEFPRPVTGVTFSKTGEFLAVSFSDSVGISLFASKVYFASVKAGTIARRPIRMGLPSCGVGVSAALIEKGAVVGSEVERGVEMDVEEEDDEDDEGEKIVADECLGELSLSGDPASKWYSLAHLDLIKARNKPIEPPQKPEKAPFFLPTTQSVNPVFVPPKEEDPTRPEELSLKSQGDWGSSDEDEGLDEEQGDAPMISASRIMKHSTLTTKQLSKMFLLLEKGGQQNENYEPLIEHLKSLSPSAIDFELRSATLGPEDDDGTSLLVQLLKWILHELEHVTNYEISQAILNRVLVLHNDSVMQREELKVVVPQVLEAQQAAWKTLTDKIAHNLCLLSFFAHQV